jgi:hypothetical protein
MFFNLQRFVLTISNSVLIRLDGSSKRIASGQYVFRGALPAPSGVLERDPLSLKHFDVAAELLMIGDILSGK